MSEFGELLYAGDTDHNKNGYAFVLLGALFFIVANFIYAKMTAMIFGGIFIMGGLYLLLFKRSEKFAIYEHGVVVTSKGQEVAIPKNQINRIEYREIRGRRTLVANYYPVLILNDEKRVFINKPFNSVINQEFKQVVESYL